MNGIHIVLCLICNFGAVIFATFDAVLLNNTHFWLSILVWMVGIISYSHGIAEEQMMSKMAIEEKKRFKS